MPPVTAPCSESEMRTPTLILSSAPAVAAERPNAATAASAAKNCLMLRPCTFQFRRAAAWHIEYGAASVQYRDGVTMDEQFVEASQAGERAQTSVDWRDLRDWLRLVEDGGALKRVAAAVDTDEELGAITYLATRRENAPA